MKRIPRKSILRLVSCSLWAIIFYLSAQGTLAQELPLSADLTPDELREQMVREIETTGLTTDPRILDALRSVPRHRFVEEDLLNLAYADTYLPGRGGAVIPSPSLLASVLEEASPSAASSVLIIGENTGYTAAIYSRLVSRVTCIEFRTVLYERFESLSEELGYDNITLSTSTTLPEFISGSPFDYVFVHGAITELPEEVIAKSTASGTVIFPLSLPGGFQILCILRRNGSTFSLRSFQGGFFRLVEYF
ncbi:MAG: protein-L-isoaspartate O-methyltransferase family protein [Spirochaetia bacterium]